MINKVITPETLMNLQELPKESTFYHGTSAPEFTKFHGSEIYLTKDFKEAITFANNVHLGGGTGGQPRVLEIKAKPGKLLDADNIVNEIIMDEHKEFRDLDSLMGWARSKGYRYVSFFHPGISEDYFKATVSLHPNNDLVILKQHAI